MQKPVQTPEQFADMQWPRFGLDLTREFAPQRPNTTPTAENVRLYEPSTLRARGGARPGIVQYIPGTVNGVNVIQHINSIVDPQGIGLLDSYDDPSSTAVLDPSDNGRSYGRMVRLGGTGRQPSRSKTLYYQLAFGHHFNGADTVGDSGIGLTAMSINGHSLSAGQTLTYPYPGIVADLQYFFQTGPFNASNPDVEAPLPFFQTSAIISQAYFNLAGSNTIQASFAWTNAVNIRYSVAVTRYNLVSGVVDVPFTYSRIIDPPPPDTGTENVTGTFTL